MDIKQIREYSILAKGNNPIMLSKETFLVPSQSSNKKYKVTHLDGWSCECKDFKYRKQTCKHIYAIQFWLKLREKIDSNTIMEIENTDKESKCIYCKSPNIVRNGSRKTKSEIRQRYLCKDCKKRFVIEAIKYVKGNSKIITLTMDLYFKGLSLRDITDTIYQFYGLKLHHETIRRWIMKFTKVMSDYVNKLKPNLSNTWHIDEQKINVKGNWKWSWNVLDSETRFLLANSISDKRTINSARVVINKAKETAKERPNIIITDCLEAYYNFIRKHQTLKQPPAEVAKINIPLERNRRLGLLKKSLDNYRSVTNDN